MSDEINQTTHHASRITHHDALGGFSLLEVIVALAILGIAIAALMQLFSGSLNTVRKAETHSKALVYARGIMDEAYSTSNPADIAKTYEFEEEFKAEVDLSPLSMEENATLYAITVTVRWPPSGMLELKGKRAFYEQEEKIAEVEE
jgi:prepilin-type N-terminal cleavage/methylation domain-containing protein